MTTTTTARPAYIARMDRAAAAAETAAARYDTNSMVQDKARRAAYIAAAASAAAAAAPEIVTPAARIVTADNSDSARSARRAALQIAENKRSSAAAARAAAEQESAEKTAAARAAEIVRRLEKQTAAAAAAAPGTLKARAAFDSMNGNDIVETYTSVFYHCKRRAAEYNLRPEQIETAENDGIDSIISAAYIVTREQLDKLESLPENDERREKTLVQVLVSATCKAIERTHRAEHGSASALVYLDALEDDEQRNTVIDTAARLSGKAPAAPELDYIMRETCANALRETCRDDIDAAIIRATAAGFKSAEIASALNIKPAAARKRLQRIRERAAAMPWVHDAQREQAAQTAAEKINAFADRLQLASRISGAKPAAK